MPDLTRHAIPVTDHAVERWNSRIGPATREEVEQALDTPGIRRAASLGKCTVILATGHRAILSDGVVVTVVPKPRKPRTPKKLTGRHGQKEHP